MKAHLKIIFAFILFYSLLFGSSCREESEETQELNNSETLLEDSELISLLQRTTMNDGSKDNIIDNTSCFSVKLPITISVNNTPITIETEEDYTLIEINFDEFDNDNDSIDFIFPITIINEDFTETIITNEDLLKQAIQQCIEDTYDIDIEYDDDDIECIDFKYPISVSIFSSVKELLKTETLENDKELHLFIDTLSEFDFADLILPITLIQSDSSEVTVNTVDDLKIILSDVDECDENDIDTSVFASILTQNDWDVQKYQDDQSNETSNYKDYIFNFSIDGTSTITLEENIFEGTWNAITKSDGSLEVSFNFGDQTPLNKLSVKWLVKKIQDKRLMFDGVDDSGIGKDQLFFQQL